MKSKVNISKYQADKVVFFICLFSTIALFVGGFFAPPVGVINDSLLAAGGILFGFATLAVGAQSIRDGRLARVTKGDLSVTIGQDEQHDINHEYDETKCLET